MRRPSNRGGYRSPLPINQESVEVSSVPIKQESVEVSSVPIDQESDRSLLRFSRSPPIDQTNNRGDDRLPHDRVVCSQNFSNETWKNLEISDLP
jgi:hypothetical protein